MLKVRRPCSLCLGVLYRVTAAASRSPHTFTVGPAVPDERSRFQVTVVVGRVRRTVSAGNERRQRRRRRERISLFAVRSVHLRLREPGNENAENEVDDSPVE